MSKDTLELLKDIKLRRLPPVYKNVIFKLKESKPSIKDKRTTYYKVGDEIILEIYNSGSEEKPYIKGFYNDKLWYDLYDIYSCNHEISKQLKGITLSIIGIRCSSMGRKKQHGNFLFYLK